MRGVKSRLNITLDFGPLTEKNLKEVNLGTVTLHEDMSKST